MVDTPDAHQDSPENSSLPGTLQTADFGGNNLNTRNDPNNNIDAYSEPILNHLTSIPEERESEVNRYSTISCQD